MNEIGQKIIMKGKMSLEFESLNDIAEAMTVKGKGILAADESSPTCKKRFDSIDVTVQKRIEIYTEICYLLQKDGRIY